MTSFSDRIKTTINNKELYDAVIAATTRMSRGAVEMMSSLENSDLIRDIAREAKMNILRNLDEYLLKFEHRLTENGVKVHWAENAQDACNTATTLAHQKGVRKIIKSKSMVSEEIHLNKALQQEGFQVVETDLGEYILQLADDRPSHIVAPTIHLSRHKVGKIMQEKLNVPYTDDIPKLAGYAREKLREHFMEADMGITGVNFGVVETGTLCIVTNEGNARMVTTFPRMHVAIMGIEKLIPALTDLDLFLKILVRSATSMKLTAYTTLIHGPGGPADNCGPDEVHVILLDNGRTNLLADEEAEILGCIRCGACLNICPVYRTISGLAYGDIYPGPVGSILTPGLGQLSDWKDLPHASSLCGACRDICPVRLNIPKMLLSLRKKSIPHKAVPVGVKFGMKGFGYISKRHGLYRLMIRLIRFLLNRYSKDGWIKRLSGYLGGWTMMRDFRAPARKSFQELWKERKKSNNEHGNS